MYTYFKQWLGKLFRNQQFNRWRI